MDKIEVRTHAIAWSGGYQLGAHNYLVYTSERNGVTTQQVFSAFPDHNSSLTSPWGNLKAEVGPYSTSSYDWRTSNFSSSVVASSGDLSGQWAAITQCANTINSNNLSYAPLGQNSNAAVAQCLLEAGIDIPDGLLAFTNGLWTPSDADGLFNNPVHTAPIFGGGGGGGGSPGYYSAPMSPGMIAPSGHWVYAGVGTGDNDITYGWKWVDYSFATRIRPVVLDLDGDGLEMRPITDGATYDWNGDGYRQTTGWVSGGDGYLVYDENNNGLVDSGREMVMTAFNPSATSDLDALKVFDSNHDGALSALDAEYNKFRVWVDTNQNTVQETGELRSLSDLGIVSLSLSMNPADSYVAANHFSATSTITYSDGHTNTAYDVGVMASARGSKDLGSFETPYGIEKWRALEMNNGELLFKFESSPYSAGAGTDDTLNFNGREAVGYVTGDAADSFIFGSSYSGNPHPRSLLVNSGGGNDQITSYWSAPLYVDAGAGNDWVQTGDGDDIITMGKSDLSQPNGFFYDLASGGAGNDMYRVESGSNVTVIDTGGNRDALVVLDVLRSEVSMVRNDTNLEISKADGSFKVLLSGYFSSGTEIEIIAFEDATLFSSDLIPAMGGLGSAASTAFAEDNARSGQYDSQLLTSPSFGDGIVHQHQLDGSDVFMIA
ncbi:hypothetical protein [uncultured Sphingomonas sp.]|uniref:hypothetical protein n=1 Tax=uncultured Sphingomonas sp. TaxID=158754 RepID=UPI0025EFA090|nr:hypothetical protein [uncultured Sphingomonas sp.]